MTASFHDNIAEAKEHQNKSQTYKWRGNRKPGKQMKDQADEHRLSLSPQAQKLNSNLNMTPSLPNAAPLTAARLPYICFTAKLLLPFLSAGSEAVLSHQNILLIHGPGCKRFTVHVIPEKTMRSIMKYIERVHLISKVERS